MNKIKNKKTKAYKYKNQKFNLKTKKVRNIKKKKIYKTQRQLTTTKNLEDTRHILSQGL